MKVVPIWSGESLGQQEFRRQSWFRGEQSIGLVLCGVPVGGYYAHREGVWARAIRFLSVTPGRPALPLDPVYGGGCKVSSRGNLRGVFAVIHKRGGN
jgi:hypothetical protein